MVTTPAAGDGPLLRPSEAHFRLLVESVRDYAIFLLDPAGHVASWNAGAERIKGYRAGEILGRHFSVFYPPEAVANGKPACLLARAAAEGRTEDEGWRLRRDGTRFWADVVITALRDESGSLVGYAKVTRDLTERRAAEAERTARLAAEAALREREAFLAAAAHELKTPLTSLRGFTQLLVRRLARGAPVDPARTRQALHQIEQQTDKLGSLVARLLDVSRLEAGRLALDWAPMDLAALAAEVVASARLRADDREIALMAPPALPIRADALRVEQVLVNLLDNAVKYSPTGEIMVAVEAPDAETARVSVRDRGPGIAPAQRPHLFERGFRVHQGDRRGGLGLGLYLSRQIADLHGGTLEVVFPPGGGSAFELTLPQGGDQAGTRPS